MKLEQAIEFGKDCGLSTIGECILNIELHSLNIFLYNDTQKELDELYLELKNSGRDKNERI